MPGYPQLDRQSLARLRRLVARMHANNGRPVQMGDVARLARDVQLDAAVTIDFEASRDLGRPMVVIRAADARRPSPALAGLTRREREIAALVAEGLSNKQIAAHLHISLATVKDHIHRILTKTDLPNRAAVAAAQREST
jgi:DNA-binding NarL/FixJ family response regulator